MNERLKTVIIGEVEYNGLVNGGLKQLLEVTREFNLPVLNPQIAGENVDLSTMDWGYFDDAKLALGELTLPGRPTDRAIGEISGRKIPFLPLASTFARLSSLEILGVRSEKIEPIYFYSNKQDMSGRVGRFLDKIRHEGVEITPQRVVYEDIEIDFHNMRVVNQGEVVDLTKTEYRLLSYLAREAGYNKSWADILSNVWNIST